MKIAILRIVVGVTPVVFWAGFLECRSASARDATNQPAAEPAHIEGRLIRDAFDFSSQAMPAWTVELKIRNGSPGPIELGGDLILITPNLATQDLAGVHVSRLSAGARQSDRLQERYGLDWGIDVPPKGSAYWPFTALPGIDRLGALRLMLVATPEQSMPGGGFGPPIAPGEERTLQQRVLFPFDVEFKNEREVVLVLTPRLRSVGDGAIVPSFLLIFDVRGPAAKGQIFAESSAETPTGADSMAATIADGERPVWRRLIAINWLAEHHPDRAPVALMSIAENAAQPLVLRQSAALNAGYWRLPGVLDGLSRLAADDADIRRAAIWGLGRLGDPKAITFLRPLAVHTDDGVARFAMEALGALRDADSVPMFTAALTNSKRKVLYPDAANALATVGTDAAKAVVIQQAQDRKRSGDQRGALISALGNVGATWAIAPLVAIVGNDQDKEDIRIQAVWALQQYEDAEAGAAIRRASASSKRKLKDAATRALAALEGGTR